MSIAAEAEAWRQLPSYAQVRGVAGVLAGQHESVVIAAGGTNFPDAPPWEGGSKKVYDDIYVLTPGASAWQASGRLPRPRGYAAVVSLPSGVLVLGGENGPEVYGDALWLRWDGSQVVVTEGPALPAAMSSPVAVASGDSIYLAAGYAAGAPRRCFAGFWRLDLNEVESGWHSLPTWPGPPRAQGVIAAWNGDVYLFSGLELVVGDDGSSAVNYLVDAYRYRPNEGWSRLPDLPRSAIAAPTPAPVESGRIFVLGGVDGRLVGKQPRNVRVPKDIVVFDAREDAWLRWDDDWPAPVVTTPAVPLGREWILVSGEIMAGVRTPEVWAWNPQRGGSPVCDDEASSTVTPLPR